MNTTEPHDGTTCGVPNCDRPADDYFICKTHAHDLTQLMTTVPWILDELDTVVALQTRYTIGNERGGSGGAPMDFAASDVRGELVRALIHTAARISVRNRWSDMPRTGTEAATLLQWRVTAVRLDPDAGVMVDRIIRAMKAALYIIDRPVSRQYLGTCESLQPKTPPCPGSVYGREWRTWASCDTCGLRWEQTKVRDYLIAQLADRLATAAEIADLSTYLGLTITRDQTRKRLNQWHKRGTLPATGTRDGAPVFRFGTAEILLARYADTGS